MVYFSWKRNSEEEESFVVAIFFAEKKTWGIVLQIFFHNFFCQIF